MTCGARKSVRAFLSAFEGGYDLWSKEIRTGNVRLFKKMNLRYASLQLDKSGKTLYILGGNPSKMALPGGNVTPMSFTLKMDLDKAAERRYMFDHVFSQEEKRFYREDCHGVDLEALKRGLPRRRPRSLEARL